MDNNNIEVAETSEVQETAEEQSIGYNPAVEVKPIRKAKSRFLPGFLVGFVSAGLLAIILILVIGYSMGYRIRTVSTNQTAANGTKMEDTVLDDATVDKVNAVLAMFDTYSILELDTEAFQRAIIDGVIKGSGDKYAQYYDAEEIQDLMGDYGGTFFGIGATLSLNSVGYAEIQGVYSNSPAEKSGLRDGDVVTKVDGEDVYGLTLDEIVKKVRGPEGTDVVLTIAREGEKDYLDITLTRAKIEVVVVEYEMKEDNIGFIHIEQWYDTTPEQFAEALADLNSQGMESLIIDLRSNTGGLLRSVVQVAQQLLPEGTIVYTENNGGRSATYTSDGTKEINIPVVILTNGYTASASEILTGAMKDHGKAVTIGTKTYGKGVVQSFYNFTDGTAMKLTTEQYFTPNGTAIDGIGIEADIEVEFDSDAYYNSDNPIDNQLEAAIEYLKNK